MSFVTCKNIGWSLIQWINTNGSEELCEALACPDLHVKSMFIDDGDLVLVVGDQHGTDNDTTHRVTLPSSAGEQTQVFHGAGGNANLYTADHNGTWPNVSWRMPTITYDPSGDIATITVWDENDDPTSASIYAPEGILYLIDPVFYVRQATGTPNPVINSQADLTVANAFDSFASLQTFIGRTIIIGSVTVDARGVFETVTQMRPSSFANANNITYRGDPADPEAFTVRWDNNAAAVSSGFTAASGANATLRDVCCEQMDSGLALNSEQWAIAATDASLTLRGKIKLKGFSDVNTNPGGKSLFRVSGGSGYIQFGRHNAGQTQGVIIETDYTAGSKLGAFISATGRAGFDFADCEVVAGSPLNFNNRPIRVSEGARGSFTVSPFAGSKQPEINPELQTEGVKAIPLNASTLSSITTSRFGVSFEAACDLIFPWLTTGTDIVGRLDKYSSMGGIYGTDLTGNARYQVV